jgi:hypothetical protein
MDVADTDQEGLSLAADPTQQNWQKQHGGRGSLPRRIRLITVREKQKENKNRTGRDEAIE